MDNVVNCRLSNWWFKMIVLVNLNCLDGSILIEVILVFWYSESVLVLVWVYNWKKFFLLFKLSLLDSVLFDCLIIELINRILVFNLLVREKLRNKVKFIVNMGVGMLDNVSILVCLGFMCFNLCWIDLYM